MEETPDTSNITTDEWVHLYLKCPECKHKWFMGFPYLEQIAIDMSKVTCRCPKCKRKVLISPENAKLNQQW